MALRSARFSGNTRLQAAASNAPPLRRGARGDAVAVLQQAFIDQGFPMPLSTRRRGRPDGIYAGETASTVRAFEVAHDLGLDSGVAGKEVLEKLDELFLRGTRTRSRTWPRPPRFLSFEEWIVMIVWLLREMHRGAFGPLAFTLANLRDVVETTAAYRNLAPGFATVMTFQDILDRYELPRILETGIQEERWRSETIAHGHPVISRPGRLTRNVPPSFVTLDEIQRDITTLAATPAAALAFIAARNGFGVERRQAMNWARLAGTIYDLLTMHVASTQPGWPLHLTHPSETSLAHSEAVDNPPAPQFRPRPFGAAPHVTFTDEFGQLQSMPVPDPFGPNGVPWRPVDPNFKITVQENLREFVREQRQGQSR